MYNEVDLPVETRTQTEDIIMSEHNNINLRVASNNDAVTGRSLHTHLWVACNIRAMPENEKPPAMRVDIYYIDGHELN